MWADEAERAKAVAEQLMKIARSQERSTYVAPEPPPFKPEKPKKNETYLEMLQRRTRDDVRAGKAISMNTMLRMAQSKQPRAPRAPGQQNLQWNGWWWWRR